MRALQIFCIALFFGKIPIISASVRKLCRCDNNYNRDAIPKGKEKEVKQDSSEENHFKR